VSSQESFSQIGSDALGSLFPVQRKARPCIQIDYRHRSSLAHNGIASINFQAERRCRLSGKASHLLRIERVSCDALVLVIEPLKPRTVSWQQFVPPDPVKLDQIARNMILNHRRSNAARRQQA